MATVNYSVKVEGDPALLDQAGMNMNFNGGGGFGMPAGGMGFSANATDGSANVNMNFGMPGISMRVDDVRNFFQAVFFASCAEPFREIALNTLCAHIFVELGQH
jgi:hypothetical protein